MNFLIYNLETGHIRCNFNGSLEDVEINCQDGEGYIEGRAETHAYKVNPVTQELVPLPFAPAEPEFD